MPVTTEYGAKKGLPMAEYFPMLGWRPSPISRVGAAWFRASHRALAYLRLMGQRPRWNLNGVRRAAPPRDQRSSTGAPDALGITLPSTVITVPKLEKSSRDSR